MGRPNDGKTNGPNVGKTSEPNGGKTSGPNVEKKKTAPGGDIDTTDLLRPICRKNNAGQVTEKQFPGPDVDKNDGF